MSKHTDHRNHIISALRRSAGGAEFITCQQVCDCIGQKNNSRVRREYLDGLSRPTGKYLITEVADRIIQKEPA